MESLRWLIQLVDGVSGPAKSVEAGLEGIKKQLEDLPFSQEKVRRGFDLVLDGAKELGRVVLEGGKYAVEALAFKENTLAAYELLLGTRDAAKELFTQHLMLAAQTPWRTDDVLTSMKTLLAAGYTAKQAESVFATISDVAAVGGMDRNVLQSLSYTMAEAKNLTGSQLGLIMRRIMMESKVLGGEAIEQAMAKRLGVDKETALKMAHAGQASAELVIASIQDVVQAKFNHGELLGTATKKFGIETVSGLLSTIASRAKELFLFIDIDTSPGFQGLKKFLAAVAEGLNPATESGQKLVRTIESIVDSVGTWLGGFTLEDVASGFDTLVKGVVGFKEAFTTSFKPHMDEFLKAMGIAPGSTDSFADAMKGLGSVFGTTAGALLRLLGFVDRLVGTLDLVANNKGSFGLGGYGDEAFHKKYWAERQAAAAGDAAGEGYIDGMLGWVPDTKGAGKELALASYEGAAEGLDAHSPSRAFEQLGVFAAQGFAQGVAAGGLGVDAAVARMVAPPAPRAGNTVSGNQVHLTVNVEGGGDSEAVARRLAELLPVQLASLFEQLAVEGGAA